MNNLKENYELVEIPLIYRDFSIVIENNFFNSNILFDLKRKLLKIENDFNNKFGSLKFKIIDVYLLDYYKELNSYTFRVVIKPFENISSEIINEFFDMYLNNLNDLYSIKRR